MGGGISVPISNRLPRDCVTPKRDQNRNWLSLLALRYSRKILGPIPPLSVSAVCFRFNVIFLHKSQVKQARFASYINCPPLALALDFATKFVSSNLSK